MRGVQVRNEAGRFGFREQAPNVATYGEILHRSCSCVAFHSVSLNGISVVGAGSAAIE